MGCVILPKELLEETAHSKKHGRVVQSVILAWSAFASSCRPRIVGNGRLF